MVDSWHIILGICVHYFTWVTRHTDISLPFIWGCVCCNFAIDLRKEQQMCIWFCVHLMKSAMESSATIVQVFGEDGMSHTLAFGHPLMMTDREAYHQLHSTWHWFQNSSVRVCGSTSNSLWPCWRDENWLCDVWTDSNCWIGHASCCCQTWVKISIANQKQQHVDICKELLQAASSDAGLLSRVITGESADFMVTTVKQISSLFKEKV